MYLAFDPGGTTGWCIFDNNGDVVAWGQDTLEELIDHCVEWEQKSLYDWTAIVYEQFKLYRHKAQRQTGSTMPASQAIGVIKSLIQKTGAIPIVQEPSIKSIAEKWTQMKAPSDHSQSHWVDAFNHGAYYLINEGIRKSYLEMAQEKRNGNTST